MRKKEPWMKKGARVLANDKLAIINRVERNTINGIEYVYKIICTMPGENFCRYYHPDDIKEVNPNQNTSNQ